jgi:hypothetical protein
MHGSIEAPAEPYRHHTERLPGGSSEFALDAIERPILVHSIFHGFGVGGKSAQRDQQGGIGSLVDAVMRPLQPLQRFSAVWRTFPFGV